jgi:hypothetical protein
MPGRSERLGAWGPCRGPHETNRPCRGPHDDRIHAHVAQLAEHALGKGEVSGSIPDMGSTVLQHIATVDGGQ